MRSARRSAADRGVVRVLAVDHGTARCGIAISDPSGTLARPLAAVAPEGAAIARLVGDHDAERVVVGLPVSLSGEEGEQARLSRAFAAELGDLLDVPVETYDERLTTTMAARSAREGARADRDSLAAAHLLESYLAAAEGEVPSKGAPGREAEEVPSKGAPGREAEEVPSKGAPGREAEEVPSNDDAS